MNIEELKQAYSKLKICVVGDFILDEWWSGTVTRLNPEAPVPVVDNPVRTVNVGGAGNVLLQLVKLGAQVDYHTVGGYDDASQVMLCKLHDAGISGYYYQDGKYTTPHKIRVIGNGQHIVRVDEESAVIDEGIQDEMLEHIEHYVDIYDAFVLSDYNKGVLTPRVIRTIIELCNKEDVPVFADLKKDNFWEYNGATIIKCNKQEILAQCDSGDEIDAAGVRTLFYMKMSEPTTNIVTLGADGLWAIDQHGTWEHSPGYYVKVKEVSGAGDTVMAVLVLEWLRLTSRTNGCDHHVLFGAAKLANHAGAIVVQKPGIAHCTVEELCGEV